MTKRPPLNTITPRLHLAWNGVQAAQRQMAEAFVTADPVQIAEAFTAWQAAQMELRSAQIDLAQWHVSTTEENNVRLAAIEEDLAVQVALIAMLVAWKQEQDTKG